MGTPVAYDFGMSIYILVLVREVAVLYMCMYVYNFFTSFGRGVSLESARCVYDIASLAL